MLCSPCALGTRTSLCYGWYGHRMLTLSCFGHGCYGHCMLLQHEHYYVLGMDAPVTVCSWNTLLCLGHGCSGPRRLAKHEGYYTPNHENLLHKPITGAISLNKVWILKGLVCFHWRRLLGPAPESASSSCTITSPYSYCCKTAAATALAAHLERC